MDTNITIVENRDVTPSVRFNTLSIGDWFLHLEALLCVKISLESYLQVANKIIFYGNCELFVTKIEDVKIIYKKPR